MASGYVLVMTLVKLAIAQVIVSPQGIPLHCMPAGTVPRCLGEPREFFEACGIYEGKSKCGSFCYRLINSYLQRPDGSQLCFKRPRHAISLQLYQHCVQDCRAVKRKLNEIAHLNVRGVVGVRASKKSKVSSAKLVYRISSSGDCDCWYCEWKKGRCPLCCKTRKHRKDSWWSK